MANSSHTPLSIDRLYRVCDPLQFTFNTTDEIADLEQIIGQDRALDAVSFGTGINREGYNLFVMGPPGMGKHTVLQQVLEQRVKNRPMPPDLCYVNDFARPYRPNALVLPPGVGNKLRQDMAQLIETLRLSIPAAFESEAYREKVQEIENEIKEAEENHFFDLQKECLDDSVKLFRTPSGFTFAPLQDGKVIGPAEFQALPKQQQETIEKTVSTLQDKLENMLHKLAELKKAGREKIKTLNREVTIFAVGHSISELQKAYSELPDVLEYLDAAQQDVIENVNDFRRQEEATPNIFGLESNRPSFSRYEVNVLVSHDAPNGIPLIYEDFPTYQNLVGRIEHSSHLGTLITDFTLIKPGALHRANGGYLLVDARKILTQPFAWEGLKRALQSHSISIMSLGQVYSLVSTVSLEPEPIPLEVKVILVGERILYYLLCELDPEFSELFKVAADFEEHMPWTDDNTQLYARLVATLARKDKLSPLDQGGVARVIEESARMVEDSEKISTHIRSINDLLKEADYWSRERGQQVIQAQDVQKAVDLQRHRLSRYHERLLEEIARGTILINTTDQAVGQVNGLTVIQMGSHAFGQPARITATVRMGDGDVVDIEREVELSGPIHSKGVLILSSYLSSYYSHNVPLSLAATIAFEQSYAHVDGDSASVAELCTILSALAGIPLRQSIALTGSVNQLGQAQAIGGVNEKIEGYFEVCRAKGLDGGGQAVIIPQANASHLMLNAEVRAAVNEGKFAVYTMTTINDALEILTGMPAGIRGEDGEFPEGTVNYAIDERLKDFAHTKHTYAEKLKEEEHEQHEQQEGQAVKDTSAGVNQRAEC